MIINKVYNKSVTRLEPGQIVEEKYNGSNANFAILKIKTTMENNSVTFANMSKFNVINWGDGDVTFPEQLTNSQPTHAYADAKEYSIVITGVKVLNETQDDVSGWSDNRVFIDSDMALLTEIDFGLGVLYIDKNLTRPGTTDATYFSLSSNLQKIVNINEEDIFNKCPNLKRISFSEDVKVMKNSVLHNCYLLESVVIPDGVTSIGSTAFTMCSALTSIVIPDSVTSIGSGAFISCYLLESVVIPDRVTSIGNSTFASCSSLESVVIGDRMTSIGHFAFSSCGNLSAIYYKGTDADWSAITIGNGNDPLTIEKVYYYSETEPTKTGNYWHYINGEPAKWPPVVAE